MLAPSLAPFEWSHADYDAAVAMDREIAAAASASLRDGSRVLLDGKPGTIMGAGYEEEFGVCIDVKMDAGGTRWVPSGSPRIITDDDFHAGAHT